MTSDQSEIRDMVIRHDEQLKTLAPLPARVDDLAARQNDLATEVKVFVGKAAAVIGFATMIGGAIGTAVTWVILLHTAK